MLHSHTAMDIEGGGYFTPSMFKTLEDTHMNVEFLEVKYGPLNSKTAFVDQDFISLGKKKIKWTSGEFISSPLFLHSFIHSFSLSLSLLELSTGVHFLL